ncbi:MAG: right-handed parallel beta-helix repeat-containing protein [Paenibacillaceae bacterium]|nr:right-handed parallel beta-helix repeat-containing protein [Paenibacillaceae bacterium]
MTQRRVITLDRLSSTDGEWNMAIIRNVVDGIVKTGGNATLTIPEGVYPIRNAFGDRLFAELLRGKRDPRDDAGWRRDRNPLFDWRDCRGIEVDGQGSTLLFEGLVQPFACFACRDIAIRNLTIDWKRPPYTMGTVRRVDGESYEVEIDPAYPVDDNSPAVAVHEYDPSAERLTGVCLYYNPDVKLLKPGYVRMSHKDAGKLTAGNIVFIRPIYSYAPALQFYRCEQVRVDNVVLHANPGMGIIGHLCHHIDIQGLQIKPSPGRIMSINVDGTHFISCTGTVSLAECYFEGMGDDASNIHGFYLSIDRIEGGHTLIARLDAATQDFYPEMAFAGDEIEFVRGDTLKPYASGLIEACEQLEENVYRITFMHPLPGDWRADDLLANVSRLAAYRFVRCHVRNIRGRGVLAQTRNATIADNLFEYCTGQGVHVNTAAGWWESGATRGIAIRGNRFVHNGFGYGNYCKAIGIVVGAECDRPEVGVHQRLAIQGNTIVGTGDKPGIIVTRAEQVEVSGNTIEQCPVAIRIEYARQVNVRDNRLGGGEVNWGEGT